MFRGLLSCLLIAVATWFSPAFAQTPRTHEHSFGNAEHWARYFDDPKRDAWQKPHEVIKALALEPDAVVADVGAGTGYFSVRLAHMLPQGRVYAVDTEPDMVKYLEGRAKREGLQNLVPVSGAPDTPRLPHKVDLVLLVDVYHHIGNRPAYFRNVAGMLKPGAHVAIIDFRLDAPNGPPKSERISPERIRAELESAGYRFVQSHDFLPHQHFLVFAHPR
ncbi:MAG TPA: class I SAM-dependent methyltransferase [Burkholderiales bacterium]